MVGTAGSSAGERGTHSNPSCNHRVDTLAPVTSSATSAATNNNKKNKVHVPFLSLSWRRKGTQSIRSCVKVTPGACGIAARSPGPHSPCSAQQTLLLGGHLRAP